MMTAKGKTIMMENDQITNGEINDGAFIPTLQDGMEFTTDGYDLWTAWRDGGRWWVANGRKLIELAPCAKESAKMLSVKGFECA